MSTAENLPDNAAVVEPAVVEAPPLSSQVQALVLKAAVADRNKSHADSAALAATAAVIPVLGRDGTTSALSPLRPDLEIAQVNVSKLTYSAKAVDRSRTDAWVVDKYIEKTEQRTRLHPGRLESLFQFLKDNAPFYLETIRVVPDHVIQDLLAKSKLAHEPMGFNGEVGESAPPGIQVEEVSPRVTITPRNVGLIDDLILQGVIDHEGNILAPVAEPVAEESVTATDVADEVSSIPDQASVAPAPVFLSVVGGK